MSGWNDREDFENERAARSDALFREALGPNAEAILGDLHRGYHAQRDRTRTLVEAVHDVVVSPLIGDVYHVPRDVMADLIAALREAGGGV